MYLDMKFRVGIPDEHFPMLQEAISEAIVAVQVDRQCTASIAMKMTLPDGMSQYHVAGLLVGVDEVHIVAPGESEDDPGYKDKKKRSGSKAG